MTIEKSELKIAAANDIGNSIEDSMEAAKAVMNAHSGAEQAFAEAAKACLALHVHVDKDLEEGKILELETASEIKRWLNRAADANLNLKTRAMVSAAAARGAVDALEKSVKLVDNYRRVEQGRVNEARLRPASQAEEGDSPRPGMSIKQQRLLEEQELRAKADEEERKKALEAARAETSLRETTQVVPIKGRRKPRGKGRL
jgi:hypothetical protein